jgi:hypothetical protein
MDYNPLNIIGCLVFGVLQLVLHYAPGVNELFLPRLSVVGCGVLCNTWVRIAVE